MKTKIYTSTPKLTVKLLNTLFAFSLLLIANAAFAQTTYNINSNGSWSASLPNTCANCTIKIASGVTLTIDKSVTCQNCTFQGGTLSMTNQTLNMQYAGSQTTTVFSGTNFLVYGDNAKVVVNAPLSLTNSIFTFYNGSYFNTSYQVDLVSSTVNLYDNSSMYSTGGSSTTINLSKSSKIVIGAGSQTSKSIFTVSGPTVNLYDSSTVSIGNENNVYYNWSSYNANGASTRSYSTYSNTMNCGGTHAHGCAMPYLYGPATLTQQGVVSGSTLPVVLVGFNAVFNKDKTITLNWNTQMESNASHFEIERSADGSNWSTIGKVGAAGNTSVQSDYTFSDLSPMAGVNYYRLKMVDLDGKYGYTEIKVLRNGLVSNISFFPNPARDYVNVSLGGATGEQMTIRLISQTGQVLQEKRTEAGNGTTVSFPLQQVSAGLYILSVTSADGTRETSKLMVNR